MHRASPELDTAENAPVSAEEAPPESGEESAKPARSGSRVRVSKATGAAAAEGEEGSKPAQPRQSAAASRRREMLEKIAGTLGVDWARAYRDDLRGQGRAAAGAWPGTISEARARVEFRIAIEASRRGWSGIADAERSELARVAYAAAKNFWNEHRDRDDEDDD